MKDTKTKFWNPPLILNFPYKCKRLKVLIFSSHKLMALKCSLTGRNMGVWLVNKGQIWEWQAEKFTVSIKPMELNGTCTRDQTLNLENFYIYSYSDISQLIKITFPCFKWSWEGWYFIGLLVESWLCRGGIIIFPLALLSFCGWTNNQISMKQIHWENNQMYYMCACRSAKQIWNTLDSRELHSI